MNVELKGGTIKRGWMRKQGGIVRNWQTRWFVLKGQSLDYYAKDDESKLLGSIELSSAKILETPYNRDEPDKWLFDIAPAKSGKMSATHEAYPIWCNDEGDRSSWTSALRRAIYASRGGGVFGGPLRDTMKYDQEYYQCEVPHVLKQCVDIIAEDGISVEGIFRLSGRQGLVKELKKRYDEGERPNLKAEYVDVHTAASLLKMYIRELPEPMIPFQYFEAFLSLATSFKYRSKHDETFHSLKKLIKQIPEENFKVLDYVTYFLHEIAEHHAENKMTASNLSVIFGTNILRSEDDSPEFQMATQNLTTHVVLALVEWHELLFRTDNQTEASAAQTDFEQLVNLAETDAVAEENQPLADPSVVSDLVDIDFTQPTENLKNSNTHIPPPIPPRAKDNQTDEARNSLPPPQIPFPDHPVSAPRHLNTDSAGFVTKRQSSRRRTDRPTGVMREGSLSPDSSKCLPVEPSTNGSSQNSITVKNPSTPEQLTGTTSMQFSKVDREPTGFQSYIDSPLDSRISLNIGDLPSSVEDLQSLVLSLKLQLKERGREIDRINMTHKAQVDNLARTIFQERHAKEEAITRIVDLTNKLVAYQSSYGVLTNGQDEN